MQTRASFILIFLFIMLSPMRVSSQIVTGAEQMDQYMPLLKGKRIGMVVNHTSVVGAKRVHLRIIAGIFIKFLICLIIQNICQAWYLT